MVKYYEVVRYVPNVSYQIVEKFLSYKAAVAYASRWKNLDRDLRVRYILQEVWIYDDGCSSPKTIWEFKKNDKLTRLFEEAENN